MNLVGRRPEVAPQQLVAQLRVPPHFSDATFATYHPDAAFPSQATARETARAFAAVASQRKRVRPGRGMYLDGGFGVGKTHLLASIADAVGASAAYGTFVEYTHLVGALGFGAAREALSAFAVVCIDEFELDDPGDTVLMARLMRELSDAGTAIAATSNTLPESLGMGRFAADDFRREIQAVAKVFDVVTIDGPDYRHRGELAFEPATQDQVSAVAAHWGGAIVVWPELVADLAHVHPSKYGAYVEGVRWLGVTGVAPLADQSQALRVVSLVDRLYDADARVVASGGSLGDIFTPEMLRGGYRKKYLRALSRLAAMSAPEAA